MKKKDSFSVKMFYRNLCCFFFNLDMLYFCSRIWFEFYFMAIITVLLKTLPPLTVGKSPLSGKFVVIILFFFFLKESCSLLSVMS